jgi:hypothetical protein
MKKLILSVTALSACSLGAFAQGVITFNSSSGSGIVTINGAVAAQDINAELLFSTTATGSFAPVSQLLLSSSNTSSDGTPGFDPSDIISAAGDITFKGTGALYERYGNSFIIPGVGSGGTAFFEVEGWTGAYDTLAAAQASGQSAYGTSAVFSESLSAAGNPVNASLNNMPTFNLVSVPEPSTLAMAGVGLASMLFLRRKTK